MNLHEAIEAVFDLALEMTGSHDLESIDAERAWIASVKARVLKNIDARKLNERAPDYPGAYYPGET